jgi:hypothetical protein
MYFSSKNKSSINTYTVGWWLFKLVAEHTRKNKRKRANATNT